MDASVAGGEPVFQSSGELGNGAVLLDAFLAPLLAALTPFIWGFPVVRAGGTIVYSLGRALSATARGAAEPFQLLPVRGPDGPSEAPQVTGTAPAVQWWVRRVDKLLSVLSDPAVHSDAKNNYVPSKHLHAILSVDQLFRRTASIQRSHRDTDARRVLLFTVLDTLDRLTDRRLTTLCSLPFAQDALAEIRKTMSHEAATLLLPAAERSVEALAAVQDGFFLRRQLESEKVEFLNSEGQPEALGPSDAVAEYIRVLRNATHGHGTNREERQAQTDALLAHHNGVLPHDLGLLAYLYLLEMLSRPDLLRRTLHKGGAA